MKKISLRKKLIGLFVLTSTIPIILLSLFAFYNTSSILRKNTEMLTNTNLKQIDDNMQIWLEAYEDLLYQIYTNDDMVVWVDNLNHEQDVPVTTSQIRRFLRGLLNTKDYIRSITIITENGTVITYDQLTAATYDNSWLKNFSLDQDEIYGQISADNNTHIFPTEFGTRFASKDYYLFHLAHRIIDYRDLQKRNGIVLVSLDEQLLQSILATNAAANKNDMNVNFLIDEKGRIISHENKDQIGTQFSEEEYRSVYTSLYRYHDEAFGWDIVNVTDHSSFMKDLREKAYFITGICVILLLITMLIVWRISGQLADSVHTVVKTMRMAEAGNLSVCVPLQAKMPVEIETIANQFNDTLKKLKCALAKEKEAGEKQRRAEIKALEAQINPHFLYNTLDTINWMAIDKEEFDISNAINTLATILRYAITDSDEMVTVKDEVAWLKKYIYLQQFRLKNKFIRIIDVSPEIMNDKIHKLLLQPFVENAIIHGFERGKEEHVLEVKMEKEETFLKITIRDNGKGMDEQVLYRLHTGQSVETEDKNHIGMENAFTRLHMYYKGMEKIRIRSKPGEGTEIILRLPAELPPDD